MKQPITDRTILRVLITGFSLVLGLLLVSGVVGIRNAQAIRESAQELAGEQATYSRLIDEIYREQGALNAVFDRLSKEPDSVNRDEILKELEVADSAIASIVETVSGKADEQLWRRLETAILAFSKEARRLLAQEKASSLFSYDLLDRHEEVLEIVRKLIASGSGRSERAQELLSARSQRLVQQTLLLAGSCLLLALVVAIYTVRMTARLSRRMEWQASELSRVSWQMLENQESAARRFSHELHDELGQSLTAVKANLVAVNQKVGGEAEAEERVQDCLHLVDEAVSNVREMSQLLRPTILDDFGLEAGLRWLTERFTQRTRIAVAFTADVASRLPDET
jgi:signal transduction histidine kinase